MSRCSTAGCKATAVLQWQRAGTPEESVEYAAAIVDRQQNLVDQERASLSMDVVGVQAKYEALIGSQDVAPRTLQIVEAQLEAKRAKLAGLADVDAPESAPATVIAVFGCEAHKVSAPASVFVHHASCVDGGACACTAPAGP